MRSPGCTAALRLPPFPAHHDLPACWKADEAAGAQGKFCDQQRVLPDAHGIGNVFNGIDLTEFRVVDGVTGFVRQTVDELVETVAQLDAIDRITCRQEVERRFTAPTMARILNTSTFRWSLRVPAMPHGATEWTSALSSPFM